MLYESTFVVAVLNVTSRYSFFYLVMKLTVQIGDSENLLNIPGMHELHAVYMGISQ